MPTLDTLQPGQHATIERLAGTDTLVQRLLEMGLTTEEEVELIGRAPMGDPLEIRIRSYYLSLRKNEAKLVHVRLSR